MVDKVKLLLIPCVVMSILSGLRAVSALNILGIVSSPSKSHSVFANAIFNEYATSGHSVTVLSGYDVSARLNHYKLDGIEKLQRSFESNWNLKVEENKATLQLYEEGLEATKFVAKHETFKKFMVAPLNVDIIIFDYDYNDALLAIADRFRCPVFILSVNPPSLSLKRLLHTGYPLMNLIFIHPLTGSGLSGIWRSLKANMHENFIVDFYFQHQQENLYKDILSELNLSPSYSARNSIKKLLTTSLSPHALTTSEIINVPSLHIPEKSIFEFYVSEQLDEFIHSTQQGCIYVSLGSNTDPATLPKDKIYKMFEVFNNRPEKIIWSWNGNTTIFQGSNKFFISKWLPQDDILRHRNIKAFVTNGGALSIQEAIFHEIPVIGIPLTYHQKQNIDLMVDRGLGVKIELNDLTVESLLGALDEIVDSKRYRSQLAFESDLLKSQIMSPMKVLKYWVSYYHQHRHDTLPLTPQLSVIDYYLSDIYLPLLLILSLTSTITVIFCYCLYKLASRSLTRQKHKLY